jgi:hypothetical protein
MLDNVAQFSEIHTPPSYPSSEKRFLDGRRAGLGVPCLAISLGSETQPWH